MSADETAKQSKRTPSGLTREWRCPVARSERERRSTRCNTAPVLQHSTPCCNDEGAHRQNGQALERFEVPAPPVIAVGHRRRPSPPAIAAETLDPPDRCCAPRGRSLRLNRELAYPGSAGVGVRKRERPQRAPALVDAAREGQPGFSIPFARVGVHRRLVRCERALHESEARLQHGATWRNTVQHGATQCNMAQHSRTCSKCRALSIGRSASNVAMAPRHSDACQPVVCACHRPAGVGGGGGGAAVGASLHSTPSCNAVFA